MKTQVYTAKLALIAVTIFGSGAVAEQKFQKLTPDKSAPSSRVWK
jgi:hypothetical protein